MNKRFFVFPVVLVFLCFFCLAAFSAQAENSTDSEKKTEWEWLVSPSVYGDLKNIAANFSITGAFRRPLGDKWYIHGQGSFGFDYFKYSQDTQAYTNHHLLFSVLADVGTDWFRIGPFFNALSLKTLDYPVMAFTEVGGLVRLKFDGFSIRAYATHPINKPFLISKDENHYMFEDNTGVYMRNTSLEEWVRQLSIYGADIGIIIGKGTRLQGGGWAVDKDHYQLNGGLEIKPLSKVPGLEMSLNAFYTNFAMDKKKEQQWIHIPNLPFPAILEDGAAIKGWTVALGVSYRFGASHESYTLPKMPMIEKLPQGPVEAWQVRKQYDEWLNNPFVSNICFYTQDDCTAEKIIKLCLAGGVPPYDYLIDWGDGTVQTGSTGDNALTFEHEYTAFGTYNVLIKLNDNPPNGNPVYKEFNHQFIYKDCTPPKKPKVNIWYKSDCFKTTIYWSSEDCETTDIEPIIGEVEPNKSGSREVSITKPTRFTITGVNKGLTEQDSTNAQPPAQPVTITIRVEKQTAATTALGAQGKARVLCPSGTVSWSITGCSGNTSGSKSISSTPYEKSFGGLTGDEVRLTLNNSLGYSAVIKILVNGVVKASRVVPNNRTNSVTAVANL